VAGDIGAELNTQTIADTDLQAAVPSREEIKDARLEEWKESIQKELQRLVMMASLIRKSIDTAKTQVKKDYYGKKFKKVNAEVLRLVSYLQYMQQLEASQNQPTEVAAHEDTPATEAV